MVKRRSARSHIPNPNSLRTSEIGIEIDIHVPLTSLQIFHGKIDSYSSAYFNLLSSCDAACITASLHSKQWRTCAPSSDSSGEPRRRKSTQRWIETWSELGMRDADSMRSFTCGGLTPKTSRLGCRTTKITTQRL